MIVKELSKVYKQKTILDSIDWNIGPGVIGLIGPDQFGKSTLLNILSGTIRPSSGDVAISNVGLASNPDEYRAKIGYLPKNFSVNGAWDIFTILNTAALCKGLHPKKNRQYAVESVLEKLQIWDCRKHTFKELPIGIKQRVGLAQALLNEPEVLILDEPCVGLNEDEQKCMHDVICQYGQTHTVMISSHHIKNIFGCCRYVGVLHSGRLLFKGTLREMARIVSNRNGETAQTKKYESGDNTTYYNAFVNGYRAIVRGSTT
ncbi:MAG: ATP-binding cassette domain-containing protein [Tuberibacillus sp.]